MLVLIINIMNHEIRGRTSLPGIRKKIDFLLIEQ